MPDLQPSAFEVADSGFALRVLVIGVPEPEALTLRTVLESRRGEQIQILEVVGAEEGLAVLRQQKCHLLVLDDERFMSTRRHSLELLRQAAPSTPIVLRTMYRCHQTEADAAQVGAEAVLPRGEMQALRQIVLRLAHRSAWEIVREF